jgi:hypothetical protein
LGENDVRTQIVIKLTTRYGVIYTNEDNEVLGGFIHPANRGHMAKIIEIRFARMRDFVVRGFSHLMDEKAKIEAAKPTPEAKPETRPTRMIPQRILTGGAAGEPDDEGKPPLPTRPGAGFMPPIAPPPTVS